VLSTTLVDPVWTNARVVSSDVTKAIGALKAEAGKDILSFGGPAANASLLGLGLIDELRLYVNPLLLGRGLPLFPKASPPLRLTLTAERRFSSGVVSLHYKKRVD
jgi:dihydrofolate reductase